MSRRHCGPFSTLGVCFVSACARTIACGFIATLFVLVPTAHAATPVIGPPTITGTPGANGWYVSAVTVTYQVNVTSFSGVNCGVVQLSSTGFTGVITLSGDGANQDAQCTVTGGPTPASSPLFINIDTTPPTTTAVTVGRGPDMNGWYNHPVDVTATGTDAVGIASCTTTTYSGPDTASASVSGHCTDNAGNVSAPMTTSFPYDGTGPSISTSASRGPDANGWYNHPVDVTFSGSDGLSGMDSCAGGSYSGPDNGSASVSGSCRDKAGNTASGSFGLKYDATPPTVTGSTPDRPPNSDGWYNHPVVVTFAGSDAASGVASCTAQTYSGPNNPSATVTGTCRDNAGNVSAAGSFPLKFDSTPPTLAGVKVAAVNTSVALTWRASHDVASLKITRTGGGSKGPRTVYSGKPTDRFMDRRVRSGDRYTYLITAYDPAGNPATARAVAILSAHADLAPPGGHRARRRDASLACGPQGDVLQRAALAQRQEGALELARRSDAPPAAPRARALHLGCLAGTRLPVGAPVRTVDRKEHVRPRAVASQVAAGRGCR